MKNINIVNKIVSKKLNKDLKLVTLVNAAYWKASRDKLIKGEVTTIFWKHIGSITISKFKVYKEIKLNITRLRKARLSNFSEAAKNRIILGIETKLRKLLVHRNNIAMDEYNKRISESSIQERTQEHISNIESNLDKDFDETEYSD